MGLDNQDKLAGSGSSSDALFTKFQQDIGAYQIPKKFTFPFYYQPDPLSLLAAQQLQQRLVAHDDWKTAFSANQHHDGVGKMFGVLVVKNKYDELGFICAYSGNVANHNELAGFVPPVFDLSIKDDYFIEQQQIVNELNEQIIALESNEALTRLTDVLALESQQQEQAIAEHQAIIRATRKVRKLNRAALAHDSETEHAAEQLKQMNLASIAEKKQLKALKEHWLAKIAITQQALTHLTDEILALKKRRKNLSNKLQKIIFKKYTFLNIKQQEKNLSEIFRATPNQVPPAGAGECAAPKLLQYAFKNQLTPIAMAEFWWGQSPKSAIRRQGNFYPSCYSKCQPILGHMISGMDVMTNPLLTNPAENQQFEIVYQDQDIVVINKPAEFLSVPGINIQDSVYTRMKTLFPDATGPIIVHRLDMSTSGLMVLTLNKIANKKLQQQFIKRTVKKRYVALLDGDLSADEGHVFLPLRLDLDDKPRQLVCYQHGKSAETYWQVIEKNSGQTKVYFYPKTGRTHQLRVHAAHQLGLNSPIVGDDHYGHAANRLHLHAESLSFEHPLTKKAMHFQCDAPF